MNCCLYSSIILVYLLKYSSAIEYSQILNTTGPEEFVDLTAADFRTVEEFEDVDIKQAILDELTRHGELLTGDVIRFLDNPTQAYGKIEGDIELPPNSIIDFSDSNYWNLAYSAVADNRKRWPNGVIPYKISSVYGKMPRNMIAMAIQQFHEQELSWSNGRSARGVIGRVMFSNEGIRVSFGSRQGLNFRGSGIIHPD